MTDKKFTDEEIIRNYEWCIGCTSDRCRECTMDEEGFCEEELQDLVLDLIKRQRAEIERLEKARQKQGKFLAEERMQKYELINKLSTAKDEAYKEFAKRLKSYLLLKKKGEMSVISFENVDTLLKEMVGEEE